jgi:dephospho-CoA kinase
VVGIVGGIASGKSLVSELLARRGAVVLDADRTGHEVLREADVKEAIRRRWGEDVLDGDGEVDRKKVAQLVFAPPPRGPEELTYLENLTHPRIERRLRERIADLGRQSGLRMAVLDAPVMFKAGWSEICDVILFVDAPRHVRLDRVRRRGWSEAEFAAREAAQEPLDVKQTRADFVIDNSSDLAFLDAQVERFCRSLHQPTT